MLIKDQHIDEINKLLSEAIVIQGNLSDTSCSDKIPKRIAQLHKEHIKLISFDDKIE